MTRKDICITAGLLLAMAITFAMDSNTRADSIRRQTLRLHIIADNDSLLAQNTQIMVKNALSDICAELLCRADSYETALEITAGNLEYIEQTANHALLSAGVEYTARCSLESFYFDTTGYRDFTLPRGEYTALTVRLGKAGGRNWWCVVYPTLCLGTAAEYADGTDDSFISSDKYAIRFKTVEIWQELKQYFTTTSPLYTHIG